MAYPLAENAAADLRSADTLASLRAKAATAEGSVLLPGRPEVLWPMLAWTDLLNQAVGMAATTTSYLDRDYGGSWMHAQTQNAGLAVAYEELPYEWTAPLEYGVERIHSKGPLRYLRFGVRLEAQGDQTLATCSLRFVAKLPRPIAKLLIQKEIAKFLQTFEQLAAAASAGTPPLRAYFAPAETSRIQVEARVQDWAGLIPAEAVRRALADYLLRAPERLAFRLRPFELAAAYGLEELDVLKACLRLARIGELKLLWDCRCPSCKGPKQSFARLAGVQQLAYCPTCALQYGLAFDQNLELTFHPSESLRPTSDTYFCAGSPGNTPHISWQQNFAAGESRGFTALPPAGVYVLRSLASPNECLLRRLPAGSPGGLSQLKITLGERFEPVQAEALLLAQDGRLEIHNAQAHEVTVMLENLDWQSQAVTAARVQAVQEFHDLFPEEVLAPGESLPLQAQVFLAARLTAAGEEGPELLDWLRSGIQSHEGAALVTDQTALLGLFATGFEALSAAWSLHQQLPGLQPLYSQPIQLELGVVSGACEVWVDQQRLAYRGPAVEAAYAAAAASAGGIVVDRRLLEEPPMRVFLEDPLAVIAACDAERIRFQPASEEGW